MSFINNRVNYFAIELMIWEFAIEFTGSIIRGVGCMESFKLQFAIELIIWEFDIESAGSIIQRYLHTELKLK
jgi:hypothetical protein